MKKGLSVSARFTGACAAVVVASIAWNASAEDIDVYVSSTASGSPSLPNIMILVDNSSNWARESQKWPSADTQGESEMQAIKNVVNSGIKANIGLAGFTGSGSSVGGYIRFGVRDMTVAANKTALVNIVDHIRTNVNASTEKVNDNGETAAMYEVYKYFNAMSVYRGGLVSGNDPATNVDVSGNNGKPTSVKPTAHGQGLSTGFAISGGSYTGPPSQTCGRNHLIMMINNAQGSIPEGSQTYESTSAGSALPAIAGVGTSWTDEWARFLYQSGITVYVMDAYYAQHNTAHSKVLERAARVGGGKYYAVKNQSEIELALKEIVAEINASNSTFAAASLPISATNRSQSLNQVFIGVFRPDADAKPRWMGNLKQFKLKVIEGTTDVKLVDSRGADAVNFQTGFIADCAVSQWTTDSGSYWENVYANEYAESACTTFPTVDGVTGSTWSDLPDGPSVEKGGVAEVLRKGNDPPTTNTSPTWTVNRTIYTYSAAAASKLAAVTTTNTGWSSTLLDWVKGYDDASAVTEDDVTTYPYSEFTTTSASARTRPSIHGDVVHSRPLPVNYGGTTGVTVYYGSNDGFFRAVNASNGQERWAFIAPEHMANYQRLHDNTPLVNYPNVDSALNPQAKGYFFDGSMGLYQTADNSKVWIFPSQRRGGRMLYAFDVTNPAAPTLKWRVGCPNQSNDTGCTTGFDGMGQTWSLPSPAHLKVSGAKTPVVIVGGGYDTCEDTDSATSSCVNASRKGKGIYIINADTGALIRHLTDANFGGSVAADMALSDSNGDGYVDYAYAVTTTGEIWRADFSNTSSTPQESADWGIRKVAYTSGGSRKFLYPPALLRSGTKMYVALGSGDRERPLWNNYPRATPVTNRFYVLLDDLSAAWNASVAAVNMDTDPDMLNFTSASSCTTTGVLPTSTKKGWFMSLPGVGEQTVGSALIAAGAVTFNTHRATDSSEACTSPLGEARGYWLNLLNASGAIGAGTANCGGARSSTFAGGGLTPSPTLASVDIDGKVQTVAIGAVDKQTGLGAPVAPQAVNPAISSKRKTIFWRSNAVD